MLAALASVALASASAALVAQSWQMQGQREQEAELLRRGDEIAGAIKAYYLASPGNVRRWPRTLQDLEEDTRFVGLRRHLRRVQADPMGGDLAWGLVPAPDGGVAGVFSRSEAVPLRRTPQRLAHADLAEAPHYSGWKFVPRLAP